MRQKASFLQNQIYNFVYYNFIKHLKYWIIQILIIFEIKRLRPTCLYMCIDILLKNFSEYWLQESTTSLCFSLKKKRSICRKLFHRMYFHLIICLQLFYLLEVRWACCFILTTRIVIHKICCELRTYTHTHTHTRDLIIINSYAF